MDGQKLPGADEGDGTSGTWALMAMTAAPERKGPVWPEAARPPSGKRTMGMPALRAAMARLSEPTEERAVDWSTGT